VDASVALDVRWRGAAVDRLADEEHAALVGRVAGWLRGLGWVVEVEVSYSEYGERGSYDLFAFHPATRALLAIEVKTDIPSAEATLRKLDEKTRLAAKIARERFGWVATSVSRVLVVPATMTVRRRIRRHSHLFDYSLPTRTVGVKRWLRRPKGAIAGIWFVSDSDARAVNARRPTRDRVRVPNPAHHNGRIAA
jgi:hypothetical protein